MLKKCLYSSVLILMIVMGNLHASEQRKKLGHMPGHYTQAYKQLYEAGLALEEGMGQLPPPTAQSIQEYNAIIQPLLKKFEDPKHKFRVATAKKAPVGSSSKAVAGLTGLNREDVYLLLNLKPLVGTLNKLRKVKGTHQEWVLQLRKMHWGKDLDFNQLPSTKGMPASFITLVENYRNAGLKFRKIHALGLTAIEGAIKKETNASRKNALGIRLAIHKAINLHAGRTDLSGKDPITNYPSNLKNYPKWVNELATQINVPAEEVHYLHMAPGRLLKETVEGFTWLPNAKELAKNL